MKENACDECQSPLKPDEGGLCLWCAIRMEDERNREYWA